MTSRPPLDLRFHVAIRVSSSRRARAHTRARGRRAAGPGCVRARRADEWLLWPLQGDSPVAAARGPCDTRTVMGREFSDRLFGQ